MWRFLPGLFFLLVTIVLLMAVAGNQDKPAGDIVGQMAPGFSAMALDPGDPVPDPQRVAMGDGPILVNFFASWCTPCQAEHAELLDLKRRHGITILGIAWHDTPAAAREWLNRHDDPYAFTGLDAHGETAVAYGATGVPESYVVDRAGRIVYRVPGPITPEIAAQELLPRLRPIH